MLSVPCWIPEDMDRCLLVLERCVVKSSLAFYLEEYTCYDRGFCHQHMSSTCYLCEVDDKKGSDTAM
jgi:hypothetical protein